MYTVSSVIVGLFDLPFGVINCCFPQLHETDQTLQYTPNANMADLSAGPGLVA